MKLDSSIKPDVPRWILWPVFILLLTPIALAAFFGNRATTEQVSALRQVAAETPVYPKFAQVKSSEFDKLNHASLTITYSVPAYSVTFDDVKSFYAQALIAKGWRPQPTEDDGERHVAFQRGAYSVTIAPADDRVSYYVIYEWGSF